MPEIKREELDKMIDCYKKEVMKLQHQRDSMDKGVEHASVCCNACQALSDFCVPDANPNKCRGGCTLTSFAF